MEKTNNVKEQMDVMETILPNLTDVDEARRAIIASEILTRKF